MDLDLFFLGFFVTFKILRTYIYIIYVHIYKYTYIYIYTYIHIHIYIYHMYVLFSYIISTCFCIVKHPLKHDNMDHDDFYMFV